MTELEVLQEISLKLDILTMQNNIMKTVMYLLVAMIFAVYVRYEYKRK